eukprot:15440383-Alexandrium_andersonii.AAC.1
MQARKRAKVNAHKCTNEQACNRARSQERKLASAQAHTRATIQASKHTHTHTWRALNTQAQSRQACSAIERAKDSSNQARPQQQA